jgi:hypothetical protein
MAREEGRKGCDELWGMRKAQKERRMDLIVEERDYVQHSLHYSVP